MLLTIAARDLEIRDGNLLLGGAGNLLLEGAGNLLLDLSNLPSKEELRQRVEEILAIQNRFQLEANELIEDNNEEDEDKEEE